MLLVTMRELGTQSLRLPTSELQAGQGGREGVGGTLRTGTCGLLDFSFLDNI